MVFLVTDGPGAFHGDQVPRGVAVVENLRKTSHSKRLVYVYLAGEKSQIPDTKARAETAPLANLVDECVGIHEGEGFRGSLVRAVVTSITMLGSSRVKPEIVSTPEQAATKLGPRVGLPAAEILEAIRRVRAAAHEG